MCNRIVIATLLFAISCSSKPILQIGNDFPVVDYLDDYEVIDIADFIELLRTNGKYIVYKLTNSNQQACLIDTSNDCKQYFIAFGRGPGETTNLLDISFYDEKTVLASVDPETIMLFDTDSLMSGKIVPEFVYRLANGQYAFPNIVKTSNRVLYCGKNNDGNDNFTNYCIEDIDSGRIQYFGEYPNNKITNSIPVNDYSRQTAYQTRIEISPDEKHAVAYYYYMLGFDILDVEKASVLSSHVYSPLGAKVTYNEEIKANLVSRELGAFRGFLDVAVTKRYIYLLASLKTFGEDYYFTGQEVYRYLWDGTPDKHFHMKFPSSSITVNPDDKFLYAIKNNNNHDSLVKYFID